MIIEEKESLNRIIFASVPRNHIFATTLFNSVSKYKKPVIQQPGVHLRYGFL